MPNFEIIGKGKNTGRKRIKVYYAFTEAQARELAEKDGTIPEKVKELPPEPPTYNYIAKLPNIEK